MKTFIIIFGGICALFLGIGISRFAFTPILPLMQIEFDLNNTTSGALASINFFGYLVGVFVARFISGRSDARIIFIMSIFMCVTFTGSMWIENIFIWYISRFTTGFLSGILFIYTSEVIMSYLVAKNRMQFFGMIFSGVGGGIAFSGLIIPFLSKWFGSGEIWLLLGLICVVPAICATVFIPKMEQSSKTISQDIVQSSSRQLFLLYLAYLLSGVGYIITGTFMSVMVLEGTGSLLLSGYAWVMVGMGAVIVTPFWSLVAKKINTKNALIVAFFVQAISIAIPVLLSGAFFTLFGAFCFGGSFLGVVALALAYGRELNSGKKTTSTLTIYFGIGQIIGPIFAGMLSDLFGGFDVPVLLAAGVMLLGGIIVLMIKGEKYAIR